MTEEVNGLGPTPQVFLTVHVAHPYSGWVMHFVGFEPDVATPMHKVSKKPIRGLGDLAFQALSALIAIPGMMQRPITLWVPNKAIRVLLQEMTAQLPSQWAVADEAADPAPVTYCSRVFTKERLAIIDKGSTLIPFPEGPTPRVIVAADASIQNHKDQDGLPALRASAGWVIAGIKAGELKSGYAILEGNSQATHHYELLAIECALRVVADAPLGKARRKRVSGLLVLTDSSTAHALLIGAMDSPDDVVDRIHALVKEIKVHVEFSWVKGHHKNPWNRAADALAAIPQKEWEGNAQRRSRARKQATKKIIHTLELEIGSARSAQAPYGLQEKGRLPGLSQSEAGTSYLKQKKA